MESESLQGCLLKFGEVSTRLRTSVESFVDWLTNGIPPRASYHACMSVRFIVLEKQPGVRPVGIGETWRRLFAKIVVKVTRLEAPMACQDDQLCAVLEAVIYSTIHGVQALCDKNVSMEEWVFFARRRKERVQQD